MAQGVIDLLEAVEIEKHQPDHRLLALGAAERLSQPVIEQRAVRQSGQHVILRKEGEAFLEALAIGDVVDDAFQRDDFAGVVAHRLRFLRHPFHRRVGADDLVFNDEVVAALQPLADFILYADAVSGIHQVDEREHAVVDQVDWAIARELYAALAGKLECQQIIEAATVGHAGNVAEQRGQRALVLAQRGFRGAALRVPLDGIGRQFHQLAIAPLGLAPGKVFPHHRAEHDGGRS